MSKTCQSPPHATLLSNSLSNLLLQFTIHTPKNIANVPRLKSPSVHEFVYCICDVTRKYAILSGVMQFLQDNGVNVVSADSIMYVVSVKNQVARQIQTLNLIPLSATYIIQLIFDTPQGLLQILVSALFLLGNTILLRLSRKVCLHVSYVGSSWKPLDTSQNFIQALFNSISFQDNSSLTDPQFSFMKLVAVYFQPRL